MCKHSILISGSDEAPSHVLLKLATSAMAAWDDVIDFDTVGDWPMELSGWLKLLNPADQEQWPHIVQRIQGFVRGARIRTYHCTRLLPSEVESIECNGITASVTRACTR
jgi:hypothetical protein